MYYYSDLCCDSSDHGERCDNDCSGCHSQQKHQHCTYGLLIHGCGGHGRKRISSTLDLNPNPKSQHVNAGT